jgi:CCR4-NOT transcription complex subunit 3
VLKRDLKKLQRLRETVRGWLASGEVKGDDTALQDARKAIERHMESFKILEREMKTKAFSTAGLSREETDPATLAKLKCADWLNDVVSRLETQTEALEADLEALGPIPPTRGKGSTNKNARNTISEKAAQLTSHITRHREYLARLERTLRLLENDQVSPEEVDSAIKDSLEYYIESFAEGGFIEDDNMWDLLPLDSVDEGIGKITAHKITAQTSSEEVPQISVHAVDNGQKEKESTKTKKQNPPPPPPPPPPPLPQSTKGSNAEDFEEMRLTEKSPFAVKAGKEFSPQNSLEVSNLEVKTGEDELLPRDTSTMDVAAIESGIFSRPLQSGMDRKSVLLSCPDPGWKPLHPAVTPLSYPAQVHPALENEAIFKSFPQDTLFFAFYFHPGSRQQGLAAKALKSQGWRFHRGMNTWFARTGQPTNATATYEEGSLAYWEPQLRMIESNQPVGWKAGTTPPTFRFEYGMLENEDIIL